MLMIFDSAIPGPVEQLERRALLSAVVIDRVLIVEGTEAADVIDMQTDGAMVTVRSGGMVEGTFPQTDFDRIRVNALGGNDAVSLSPAILLPSSLEGNDGNDSLTGGGGEDVIVPGLGDDVIDGASGHDTLDYSQRNQRIIIDSLTYYLVTSDAGESDTFSRIETLLGSQAGDSISLAHSPIRLLDGRGGNDRLSITGPEPMSSPLLDPTIRGADGDDNIYMNRAGAGLTISWYYGDAGDDSFGFGREKNRRHFFGGVGNDSVNYLFPAGIAR